MADLRPGDKVRLMSGGPVMTVYQTGKNRVWCQWFDRNNQLEQTIFKPDVLEETKEESTTSVGVNTSGLSVRQRARQANADRN